MVGFLKKDEKVGIKKVKEILKGVLEFSDYKNTKEFMEKADGIEAMALGNGNRQGLFVVFLVRKCDELYEEVIKLCESYINKEEEDFEEFKDKYNTLLDQILAYGSMFGSVDDDGESE